MSLISARNFVTPLSNKVHLVTIVLVAVVFAVLRMQGGGVHISTELQEPKLHKNFQKQSTPTKVQTRKPATSVTARQPENLQDINKDLLKDLMRDDSSTKPAEKALPKNNDKGLEDIEKSLGLR